MSDLPDALREMPVHTVGCPDDCLVCLGADEIERLNTLLDMQQQAIRAKNLQIERLKQENREVHACMHEEGKEIVRLRAALEKETGIQARMLKGELGG
jgi:hypothetical protein